MNPAEYAEYVKRLDEEIDSLRANARRKQEAEQRLSQLVEQADGFAQRAEALRELGARDRLAEVERLLMQVEDEIARLRDEAREFSAPRAAPPTSEETEARQRFVDLGDEIERGAATLEGRPSEVVVPQFRAWALRWRILSEKTDAQAWSRLDGVRRRAYAVIREAMQNRADLPFIDALNPRSTGDWVSQLAYAEEDLAEATRREEVRREAVQALDRLRAIPARYYLPDDPQGLEAFKVAIRDCARYLDSRDEVAQICEPYRRAVGEEFAYLWRETKAVKDKPTQRRRLSRRDVLARILGRMASKKEIGNARASLDSVISGLPGHNVGDAREGVEMLIKAGLLLAERARGETRVAINPASVRAVQSFVEGGPLGDATIDSWATAEVPV